MSLLLIEDGISYGASSAQDRPLGGLERSVISLAEALAARGRDVTVLNACPEACDINGVSWRPIAGTSTHDDVKDVIVYRDPRLFKYAPKATNRLLFVLGPGVYLSEAPFRAAMENFKPRVLVPGAVARYALDDEEAVELSPGVDAMFHPAEATADPPPPVAITTCHPDHDLDHVLKVWQENVSLYLPKAELHIYSAILFNALRGGTATRAQADLAQACVEASDLGVSVKNPLPAPGMADVYRAARAHLYPGHAQDLICWTLLESQSCGLPGIALTRGACGERLINGESGYLVPDFEAMGNLAVQCLGNDDVWRSLSKGAAESARHPCWDTVAARMEKFLP